MGTSGSGAHVWIERGAFAVQALATVPVFGGIAFATADRLYRVAIRDELRLEHYERYRRRIARSLLLGLEVLAAADIVRAVALQATLLAIAELGLLGVVRTFLSRVDHRGSRRSPALAALAREALA